MTFGLLLGATLLAPRTALAQVAEGGTVVVDPNGEGNSSELGLDFDMGRSAAPAPAPSRKVTPIFAPVPFKNTQLGWGIMGMGMFIHRFDSNPAIKPSTGAIGAFYTENGSWGVMLLEAAKFGEDKWRARMMLGHPEVRFNYYGTGEDAGEAGRYVEVQQNINMAMVALLRRVAPNVYLGPTAAYMGSSVALRDTSGLGLPPAAGDTVSMEVFAPGIQGEVDTRNSDYWPTHGVNIQAKGWWFLQALGGDRVFQRYLFNGSWYAPLHERVTLAANINACGASGDTPFWGLCSIGAGRGGLRGYTQGRYRDTVMTTEQVEIRYHTEGRFGATIFGGMGHIAPTFGEIFSAKILAAGGGGIRYQLARKIPMHMRLDLSWGRDGGIFYFGVSEAY